MLTTTKYIEQLEKQNRILALSLCEKYGNGSVSKGLEVVKEKYSKRPFEGAYGDLKVIINIIGDLVVSYKLTIDFENCHGERICETIELGDISMVNIQNKLNDFTTRYYDSGYLMLNPRYFNISEFNYDWIIDGLIVEFNGVLKVSLCEFFGGAI